MAAIASICFLVGAVLGLRFKVEPRLLKTRPDPTEALRWTLRALDLGRDYVAALAVAGLGWKLRCLDWQPGSITLAHDWCIGEAQAQLDREDSRDN
jgi:hypothetical protein